MDAMKEESALTDDPTGAAVPSRADLSGPTLSGDHGAPRGVRLAVDVGSVRVGVAASDPAGLLASPVETVARDAQHGSDLERIAALVAEREAASVVVGLPRRMAGDEGPAAEAARSYARDLAQRLAPVPVHLLDERLTTVAAQRSMRASGVGSKKGRATIDQAAAVVLLQFALDLEQRTGRRAGELVTGGA